MSQDRCFRCIAPMNGKARCPVCGWSDDAVYDIQYIKPGTVLAGRYLVGCYARKNGEGALYAGYDNATQHKVWIREYFPSTIAQRALDTGKISPLAGCGAQYKALMSDFVDICNEVKRLGVTEPVVPIENVFSENNTVYAIYRGLELVCLEDYLKQEGNALDYNRALSILLPICNTLVILHNHGQIHRGISPYTIYMDEYDNPYLWDFALSATRTSGSELDAELFSGYTAPEQYSPNGWQGGWTDVYALGAVFYRTLTGIVPPKSIRHGREQPIKPIQALRHEIPVLLSNAVAEAMLPSTDERSQTIQTFTACLIEDEMNNTAVYDVGRIMRESSAANQPPKRKKQSGDFKYVMVGLAAMLVVLVGVMAYVMGRFFPGRSTEDPAEPSQEEGEVSSEDVGGLIKGAVPSVVGRTYDELVSDPAYQGLFTFSKKEEFNDKVEDGVVYEQAPAEGTPVVGHATVIVYVSKGTTKTQVPNIVGSKLEDALTTLQESGILSYDLIERWDASAEPGTVLSVIPGPGAEIDPKSDTLRIFYAKELAVSAASSQPDTSGSDNDRWNNPNINLPDDDGTRLR